MSRSVERAGRGARPPAAVLLVTTVWAALLLGASLLWPSLTGYDEAMHVAMAGAYADAPTRLWGPGELTQAQALRTLRSQLPADPSTTPYDVVPLPPRGERPSLAALGGFTPSPGGAANQMVQHPPLAYLPYAAVLRAPGVATLAWDQQVWLLRLLSVLVSLPVPVLAWATARRLLPHPVGPGSDPSSATVRALAVAAAVVPLTVPNLVRVCASVTNDAALVLTTSLVLLGVARVVTGDLRRRTALVVAAALAAALWTKGLALVLPPLVVLAYGWALRGRARSRAVAGDGAPVGWVGEVRRHAATLLVVLAGTVVGGSWWLRNLVLYHRVQTDGVGEAGFLALYGPPDGTGRLSDFLRGWPYLVAARTWGGVGLPDTPVPSALVVWGWPALVVAGLLLAVGRRGRPHRPGARAGVLLVAWGPLLLTLAVVAAGSFSSYRRWSGSINGAQGRYVYPLVVGLAAGAVSGWPHAGARAGAVVRALPAVLLLAALATQASTWAMLLTSWFSPGPATSPSALGAGLAVLERVSPVPVAVTVALVLVLPLVTGVAAVALLARRRDDGA